MVEAEKTRKVCLKFKDYSLDCDIPNVSTLSILLQEKIQKLFPKNIYEELFGENMKNVINLRMFNEEIIEEELYAFKIYLEHLEDNIDIKEAFTDINNLYNISKKLNLPLIKEETESIYLKKSESNQILILLNLNESLLLSSDTKLKIDRVPNQIIPRGKNKKYIYVRPGARKLLSFLLRNPRFKVGIYSSMIEKNILPLRDLLFNYKGIKSLKSKIFKIYDRKYNIADKEGEFDYSQMRDLKQIWKDPKAKEHNFNKKNTILVESNETSARGDIENTILIPLYVDKVVIDNRPNSTYFFEVLIEYFDKLARRAGEEISEYLMDEDLESYIDGEKFASYDYEYEEFEKEERRVQNERAEKVKAEKEKNKGKKSKGSRKSDKGMEKGEVLEGISLKAEREEDVMEEETNKEKELGSASAEGHVAKNEDLKDNEEKKNEKEVEEGMENYNLHDLDALEI